ncbi:MAG: molybdopterin-dependent oxidoreductase [Gammaproteobacteria bacterium]|nr:molybdopterin-dependent oxidoreductase [Gammaproteobacteria bacterium]
MANKPNNHPRFTRRKFMKMTSAAGISGALPPLMSGNVMAHDIESSSFNFSWHGPVRTKTVNGKLVSAEGFNPEFHDNAIAPFLPEYVYSKSRIKYPMVRKSYLENGPGANREARGSEDFVRVSWEKATSLIAGELKRVIKDHGNASILTSISSAYLTSGRINYEGACMSRFANLMGGFTDCVSEYSTGAAQTIMPHITGSTDVYAQQTSWKSVMDNAEVILFWAVDPIKTLQAGFSPNMGFGLDWMRKIAKSGKKFIMIDPQRSATAIEFGAEWIAPVPNTDVAMMLGMAYALQEADLENKEFLDEYTTGYKKFLPYLLGKTDGIAKTPEWAESVCQIKADKIREIAHLIAKKPSLLLTGWSLQRADHGEQPPWMLVTLACMVGQIGLPGCGYSMGHNYPDAGADFGTAPTVPYIDYGDYPDNPPMMIPASRTTDAILNPGKVIDYNGDKITYPDIKMIFNEYGNPQCRHQERSKMINAWKKPDTIVTHEICWTASAWMADIVLPVCTALERNDIDADSVGTTITPIKAAIEPEFESKEPFVIFTEIARALGIEEEFTMGKTAMELIEDSYGTARKRAKNTGIKMPKFSEFWEKGEPLEFAIDKSMSDFVQHGDFRNDPLLEPLGTASGKIEIYCKNIEKMGYADCGPHPTWYEPFEYLGSPLAKSFPLHMVSPHPRYRMHSQYNQCESLRDIYNVAGHEPVTINSQDAKARNIKDGDVVRIFNDRGQTLAGAKVTDNIRPNVISLWEGGWYDPVERGVAGSLCKHGHANALVKDKPTSSLAQSCNANTALVQIEKYTGKELPVTAFDPPKGA